MSTKPAHYTQYAFEPIDYIAIQQYNFVEGNIIKYIMRYQNKNGLEDLQKAKFYCNFLKKPTTITYKYLLDRDGLSISEQQLIKLAFTRSSQMHIAKEFCDKNKLDPKIANIIYALHYAQWGNWNPRFGIKDFENAHLDTLLLLIQELIDEYLINK